MSTRVRTTISLPDYLLVGLKAEAKRKNKSLTNLVEEKLLTTTEFIPNDKTLEAMRECESGVELLEVDMSSYEAFIKSLGI